MADATAPTDRDLASIQDARRQAQRAKQAAAPLAELSQAQIDAIVEAMAASVRPRVEELARLAVEETGYGVVADKIQKNVFATDQVYGFIRPMKTVGVVNRDSSRLDIVLRLEGDVVPAAPVPEVAP